MLGLLVDVVPFPDEGLLGYLHRIAEANGLDGGEVVRMFKMAEDVDPSRGSAKYARIEWLGVSREVRSPATQPMRLWNIRRRRYCPECLAEKPYWRAAWSVSLATVCVRHETCLCDSCPKCGRALDWRDPRLGYCGECGEPLATKAEKAAPETVWLAKELLPRVEGRVTGLAPRFRHLSLEDFHGLALCLGARGADPRSRNAMKIAGFGTVEVAHSVAMAAARALFRWPEGFRRLVAAVRSRRTDQPGWRLARALGSLYFDIYRRLAGMDYDFVREAFESYLAECWDAPLSAKNKFVGVATVESRRWVPLAEAAARIGMRPATIAAAAENHRIPSRERQDRSGRRILLIDLASLRREAERLEEPISLAETAELLGLTKLRVRQLLDARLLQTYGATRAPGQRWSVSSASAAKILEFAADAKHIANPPVGYVSLNHLLRFRTRTPTAFVRVMSAVSNGEILVAGWNGSERKLGGWMFRVDDVEALGAGLATGVGLLSVPKAAHALGVKQEVAYALARAGVLKTRRGSTGARQVRLVSAKNLDDFRRRYVFSPELAKVFCESSKSLPARLLQRGILPVAGPAIARIHCRQYLWRRPHT